MASQVEACKWVPGAPFLVDGFRFQSPACRAYFLTHAHSDHTTGLSTSFNAGGCDSGVCCCRCAAAAERSPHVLDGPLDCHSSPRLHLIVLARSLLLPPPLPPSRRAGPIYCSHITARILLHDRRVRPDCLHILPLDQPSIICGVSAARSCCCCRCCRHLAHLAAAAVSRAAVCVLAPRAGASMACPLVCCVSTAGGGDSNRRQPRPRLRALLV